MTFVTALALPMIALVATDTRLNIINKDDTSRGNDYGPFSLRFNDDSKIVLGDSDRKLRRFPGGWAAGFGNFALVHGCLTWLSKSNARTPKSIQSTLQQAYQQEYPKVQAAFPGDKDIEQTAIFYIYTLKTKFGVGQLGFAEHFRLEEDGDLFLGFPPGISAEHQERTRRMLRALTPLTNMPDVYEVIRLLAEIFHEISLAAPSVSDIIDIALMLRTDEPNITHLRLLSPNQDLMNAGDEQMTNLIQQV